MRAACWDALSAGLCALCWLCALSYCELHPRSAALAAAGVAQRPAGHTTAVRRLGSSPWPPTPTPSSCSGARWWTRSTRAALGGASPGSCRCRWVQPRWGRAQTAAEWVWRGAGWVHALHNKRLELAHSLRLSGMSQKAALSCYPAKVAAPFLLQLLSALGMLWWGGWVEARLDAGDAVAVTALFFGLVLLAATQVGGRVWEAGGWAELVVLLAQIEHRRVPFHRAPPQVFPRPGVLLPTCSALCPPALTGHSGGRLGAHAAQQGQPGVSGRWTTEQAPVVVAAHPDGSLPAQACTPPPMGSYEHWAQRAFCHILPPAAATPPPARPWA